MIFNLIGPPAAGKTTLSQRLTRELLNLQHIDISRFREQLGYTKEEEAWRGVLLAALRAISRGQHVIIESSGLSHQLEELVLHAVHDNVTTILLSGQYRPLLDRLLKRQQESRISEIMKSDEQAFLKHSILHIDRLSCEASISTTQHSPEDTYKIILPLFLDKCWMSNL